MGERFIWKKRYEDGKTQKVSLVEMTDDDQRNWGCWKTKEIWGYHLLDEILVRAKKGLPKTRKILKEKFFFFNVIFLLKFLSLKAEERERKQKIGREEALNMGAERVKFYITKWKTSLTTLVKKKQKGLQNLKTLELELIIVMYCRD